MHLLPDQIIQLHIIPDIMVIRIFHIDADDLVFAHAILHQILAIQVKQRRLPASAYSGYYFNDFFFPKTY